MMKFLEGRSRNFKKFFAWTEKFLEKHEKKVTIVNTKTIDFKGLKCSGWCDDDEIVVALKNPRFEEVYSHEFSHMQQSVEDSPCWKDTSLFWNHLEKDKIVINTWDSVLDSIVLERDCERRVLAHSKKWGLFNNTQYAKGANLYLFYYQYVFLKRKWSNSTTIYHPTLLKAMPNKLCPISSFKSVDMALMNLFDECLDKNGRKK